LALQDNPGEISAEARQKLRDGVRELLQHDDEMLDRWLARYLTEPLAGQAGPIPSEVAAAELEAHLLAGGGLERRADLRYAWIARGENCWLYAGGQELPIDELAARTVCAKPCITPVEVAEISDAVDLKTFRQLLQSGYLLFG
jgi:ribosomal protein L16 Arg81 hydroxylase